MTAAAAERAQRFPFPALDPSRNTLILCVGRKGSGKSAWSREVFRSWPGVDKLVIDPTGDADPGADLGTVTVSKLPDQLPEGKPGHPTVLRWIANPMSASYAEDLDRAVGLALFPRHRPVLVWVDEGGEVFPAGRTGPYGRTFLHQGRHYHVSGIIDAPRPINLDPLTLSQADRVVMYDVPHPRDRERLAQSIGIDPKVLAAELNETRARGPYWYLMYVAAEHSLYRCPPLPLTTDTSRAQK